MNRVLTAAGLLVVAFYLVFWAPPIVFEAAALLMSLLCFRELNSLLKVHGFPQPGIICAAGGVMLLLIPPSYAIMTAVLFMLGAFIIALRFEVRDVAPFVSAVLLGMLYTFAPWRFAVDLRASSVHILFFALALNWAGDSVAYYVGRKFGKHKLAPIASPKKSWEGAIAAVAASAIFGVFYLGYFVPRLPWWQVLIIAIIANIAGQLGDLAESAIKRGAGVKDSGTLLPGHGGMLDRVDSTLFSLPVVYGLLFVFGGL